MALHILGSNGSRASEEMSFKRALKIRVHEPHVTRHRNIPGREMITETLLTGPLEGAEMNSEND